MHGFGDMAELGATLERLIERQLAERLERRPGQREERYRHLLANEPEASEPVSVETSGAPPAEEDRIDRLEQEVARLRDEVRSLREELGA
jgi:uncharacterized protein YceH (UPF0502 family)